MATKSTTKHIESARKAPPWKRAKPKGKGATVKLDAATKAQAKARAERAGRRYPNLVDNMWAAAQLKKKR